jgi:Uma2 family endonuclease
MATAETRLMTAEEFHEWASRKENLDKTWELVKGEPIEITPPGEVHGILCAWIAHLLWEFILQQRGGKGRVTGNDAGLIVERDPDTVCGPDLMLFAESRRLDQLSPTYPADLPLLVVEVRSPSDSYRRMLRRGTQYLERGVPMVWVVDPDDMSITFLRPRESPLFLEATDEVTGGEVLPDFRRPVADFFNFPGQSS